MNLDGEEVFECKQLVEPVLMGTMTTEFLSDEKAEHQMQHREAFVRFLEACMGNDNDDGPMLYTVLEMRKLLLTTASTKVRVFNDISIEMGSDTLTDSLYKMREQCFDG